MNPATVYLRRSRRYFQALSWTATVLIAGACGDHQAQQIVDKSIKEHGGEAFKSLFVAFDFRNRHYTAKLEDANFIYTREFKDSTGNIKDVLTNTAFTRYRDGSPVSLTDERKNAFTNSVNSVIYFALLPWFLNDAAVNKVYLGPTKIKDQEYEMIRVTFDKERGGDDHQDVFLYWFQHDTGRMDYFAYSYASDGGGLRFRKAINARRIGGILFQDYVNYEPATDDVPLDGLQAMFEDGTLKKLSEITLENIQVTRLNKER
jgi:hypothetical protein